MTNSPLNFRDSRLLLAEESKDKLIDEILRLRQEKEGLAQKNQELQKTTKEQNGIPICSMGLACLPQY